MNTNPPTTERYFAAHAALRADADGTGPGLSPETCDLLRHTIRTYDAAWPLGPCRLCDRPEGVVRLPITGGLACGRCGDAWAAPEPAPISRAARAAQQFHAAHGYYPSDEQLAAWL